MLRVALRNLLARKARLVMSGLAIVLGVAFLSGVLIFSQGLNKTFDGIIQGSTPDGTVRVEDSEAFSGGQVGVSAATLTPRTVEQLSALPQIEKADGNVDGFGMYVIDKSGDLLGGTGAPTLAFNRTDTENLAGEKTLRLIDGRWGRGPSEIVLDEGSAEKAGYSIGDQVTLLTPSGTLRRTATLVGTAEFNQGGTGGATLIIFDTAGAQEIFLQGKDAFTSVSLTAAPGISQKEMVKAAQTVLPQGFEAVTGDTVVKESKDATDQFLGVIKTFLLVFAIVAVVVGGFIIVNTFSILVAQRTRESALLRALGASRRQVTTAVLLEALVMAILATTIGIGLGWALARGLAAAFTSFGLDISSNFLTLSQGTVIAAYAVGVGVTLVAALLPARRAGKVAPVTALRADSVPERGSLRRRSIIGGAVLVLAAAAIVAGLTDAGGMPPAAWIGVSGFLALMTVASLSSVLGYPVLIACRAVFGRLFGTPGRLAGDNAMRDPRRTGATASALMIGLALVSMIAVMATSLNASIQRVVEEQFKPDFQAQSVTFAPFSTAIGDEMAKVPGVEEISRAQILQAKVGKETTLLTAVDENYDRANGLETLAGDLRVSGDRAVASEGAADKNGWSVGDTVTIAFPGGTSEQVVIGGISKDNVVSTDLTIALPLLADAGITRQDNSVSIFLTDDARSATVLKDLKDIAKQAPLVKVDDQESFADSLRGQVNQLLSLIYGLLALAIIIAIIGIVNTLGLSVLERTREIGLLRAVGMTRRQLRRTITIESVTIALLGAVLGMVVGLLYGVLLQRVLEDQLSTLGVPFGQLVVFAVMSVIVGVLAALIPAVRASRLNVLEAISTQ